MMVRAMARVAPTRTARIRAGYIALLRIWPRRRLLLLRVRVRVVAGVRREDAHRELGGDRMASGIMPMPRMEKTRARLTCFRWWISARACSGRVILRRN